MGELPDDVRRTCAQMLGAARTWLLAMPADEALRLARERLADACVVEVLGPSPVSCPDIRAMGREARQQGRPLVADMTVPGVVGCAAVRLGAHLAIAPAGGNACVAGVSRDVQRYAPGLTDALEGLSSADPVDGDAVRIALELQRVAWHATSDAAQVVASYLRCHPRVAGLRYPGLRGDPSFEVAARTLTGGFGPVVDVLLADESDWRRVTCDADDPRGQVLVLEAMLAET